MATSRYLVDILTRHQVFLERLKAGEVRDFGAVLKRLVEVILRRLASVGDPFSEVPAAQLEAIIRAAIQEGAQVLLPWQDELVSRLKEAAGYEADFTRRAIDAAAVGVEAKAIPAFEAWKAAMERPVQAQGKLLAPWIREWTVGTLDAVETIIRNSAAQGWTVQDTVRKIRGTKARGYQDGVAAGMRRSIEALVRTSVQHISHTAREATFEANADIVTGVRWISTLDNRTCAVCRSFDHRTFPLSKGPRPPIHISCRCVTVPEMAESAELLGVGKRASKGAAGGEQVPAGQTYYAWLKNQPASFQDAAIGPTRGKLLRNGGLSAEEFARLNLGRNFEPLTLAEMQKLAPEAFNRAGIEL